MTKRKPKTKRRRDQCYISYEFWEMDSPAYLALSADATRVYQFMRKAKSFDHSNNGAIPFSQRQAATALNTKGRHRAANALAELQHLGFIRLRNGGIVGTTIRLACEWQLTAYPCGGQEASKTFMRWDKTPFVPPYKGRLGRPTLERREAESDESKKQPPIAKLATGRSRVSYAPPDSNPSKPGTKPQSVANLATVRDGGRSHVSYTITNTTQGGPKREWRAPTPVGSWLVLVGEPLESIAVADAESKTPDPPTPQKAVENSLIAGDKWAPSLDKSKQRKRWNTGTSWPAQERIALGLSQPEFARLCGIRRPYLSHLEHGRGNPGPETRARIEAALQRKSA